MKKIFIFLTLFILASSCNSQNKSKSDKVIVQDFAKELFLNEEHSYDSIIAYLELHETIKNSSHFSAMVDYWFKFGKEINENSDLQIKIVSYDEAGKHEKYRKDKSYKKLKYTNKNNVYFLVFTSIEDKISGPIIINDSGKIISFYCYISIGKDPVIPFMLNEKPKTDIYGYPFK
tara:strand:+ start:579 stop:1103 length:525 start_codon:yes stop_codon:yes gene_type:complete